SAMWLRKGPTRLHFGWAAHKHARTLTGRTVPDLTDPTQPVSAAEPADGARPRMEASLDKVKQSADRLKGSTVEAKGSVGKVGNDAAGMKETASEAVAMVVAYAKQETIDPLKALGRYALWGI